MKSKLPLIARVLLGLIFTASGVVGLFKLYPLPPDLPEKLKAFHTGMEATGYFFPLLRGTELICGLLLLVGIFVPLALVVLAPVVLNIILIHAFIAPNGLPLAIVIAFLMSYLAFFSEPYSAIVKQIFRCPKKEGMDAKKN